ncbi:MAG: DUF4124 domain-containing protein [Myxococcota bacterium]
MAAIALLAAPAPAELYRCAGPDGSITYTNNAATCRGSEPHEPSASVQRFQSAAAREPTSAAPQRPHPGLAERVEKDGEAFWRMRKQMAQEELRQLGGRHGELRELVTHCNRGGELFGRDETGLGYGISCDGARTDYESTAARMAALRTYLDSGIQEECRRSGCLPGWLR